MAPRRWSEPSSPPDGDTPSLRIGPEELARQASGEGAPRATGDPPQGLSREAPACQPEDLLPTSSGLLEGRRLSAPPGMPPRQEGEFRIVF